MTKQLHILIIRFSAMGDVAMTVPVIRALQDQHPNIRITILTKSPWGAVFESLKNVELIEVDFKSTYKGLGGLFKLSSYLKKYHFDQVADLHNVLRTNILRVLLFKGAFHQIDKGRPQKKALVKGENFAALKSTHQRYAEVFTALGHDVILESPSFPKPKDFDFEKEFQGFNGQSPIIGVAPFAAHQGKMYPLEKMEMVIADLSRDFQVVLFGSKGEEQSYLESLENSNPKVYSAAGRFSLSHELDLISNLDLMISMDSGNGHLAAIYGVKVLTIWGVTHPYAGFRPFNQPEEFSILANRDRFPKIPTSIYGNKCPQGYEKAVASISTDEVIKKARAILKT